LIFSIQSVGQFGFGCGSKGQGDQNQNCTLRSMIRTNQSAFVLRSWFCYESLTF